MTSTQSTTTIAISTSGKCANIEDILDENVLREMWQDTEDADAKRQIRSRMYKLREERLKEYYGREGHGILESILNPLSDEGMEGSSMEGSRVKTVTSTESHSVDGQTVVQSTTVHARQTMSKVLKSSGENVINSSVTSTTTTTGGKQEGSVVTKGRLNNKDRTSQLQDIKSQQRASPKRNVSSSEIIKPLSKKSSVDSDISVSKVTTQGNNVRNKGMTNGVVSKRKQTTTTVTSGSGNAGDGRVTTTRTTVVATATKGGEGETGEEEDRAVSLSKNFQQSKFSSTTMSTVMTSSMSSSSTSAHVTASARAIKESSNTTQISSLGSGGGGGTSTKSVTSTTVRTTISGDGNPSISQGEIVGQNEDRSGVMDENLEVGKVVIKEISSSATANDSATAASQSSTTQNRTSSTRTARRDVDANLMNGVSADSDVKSSSRRATSGSMTTKTTTSSSRRPGKSAAPNEINDKTSSSVSTKSNRSSTTASNRSPSASFTSQVNTNTSTTTTSNIVGKSEASTEAQEKVCRRANKLSRESSPKSRGGRKQVVEENIQSSQQQQNTSSTKPSRVSSKARVSEKQQQLSATTTETGKVSVVATKVEPDKTEEKIMRELDILDTYLSQRSASIDEGNRDETRAARGASPASKMNGSHGGERKVQKSDKNFSLGKASATATTTATTTEVDVMVAGVEPPFTRTTYKYNCPGDDHRHNHHDHSPDKSPERNADERKRSPEKGRATPGVKVDKNELEDQIITGEVLTPARTTTLSSDRARVSSQKATSTVVKSDKSGKPKRTSSQSPEKTKRNVSSRIDESGGEVKEAVISSSRAQPLNASKNPNQDNTNSRGRRTGSTKPTSTNTTTSSSSGTVGRRDVAASRTKTDELISTQSTSRVSEMKSGTSHTMTKEQKYEADILSRPSVFSAKRATPVAPAPAKPDPNPRLSRGSESSPERDVTLSTTGSRVTSQRTTVASVVGSSVKQVSKREEHLHDAHQADDELEFEEEGDPLSPPKRFTTSGKYLESPGAVLKAKSLFETKAHEAAKDRSSIELGSRVSTSPKLTVSRKAALFEARSRGERVSVSSGSTHSLDDKQETHSSEKMSQEHRYRTARIPEPTERAVSIDNERRVSHVISLTPDESIMLSNISQLTEEEVEADSKTVSSKVKETEREKSTRTRAQTKQESKPSRATDKKKPLSSSSPTRTETRSKSPNRAQKPEKESVRKTPTPAQSPERPREAEQGKLSQRRSERNMSRDNVQSQRKIVEESKRQESTERTVRKRDSSSTKIDKQTEKSEDISGQKRRDSRGISTSSKITSDGTQQRKALQDIEQKNIETRENIINDAQRKEIISTNQTTLSELKSTNVVKATMRQTEAAVYSQEALATTTSNTTLLSRQIDEDVNLNAAPLELPQKTTQKLETITTTSSPRVCKRASKSPERPDPLSKRGSETTTTSAERRRSSNTIERKVEAIMASFKQTPSSTTITTSSSTRMTTSELNAVDEMNDIMELETLLDKATDYDERSKIRGRLRFLKRKALMDKHKADSPERSTPAGDEVKVESSTTRISNTVTSTTSAAERRASRENRVTSRNSSERQTSGSTDRRVSSRKSSDELVQQRRKSSVDKENRLDDDGGRSSRSVSPLKIERPVPGRRRRSSLEQQDIQAIIEKQKITSRKINKLESRSSSGKLRLIPATPTTENEEVERDDESPSPQPQPYDIVAQRAEEQRRKLSSETSELLSNRKYSRDNEKQASKREEKSSAVSESTRQDHDLYSSRRSSRNLEEDRTEIDSMRRSVVKTGSMSRLRQTEEERSVREKSPEQQRSKPSSRASSPERSSIPISARMRCELSRERSLSPPKVIPKDTSLSTFETEETTDVSAIIEEKTIREDAPEEKTVEETEITSNSREQSVSRKVSSRKTSSEIATSQGEKSTRSTSVPRRDSSKTITSKATEPATPETNKPSQRKRSTEESTVSKTTRSSAYTRKGSSKEISKRSSIAEETSEKLIEKTEQERLSGNERSNKEVASIRKTHKAESESIQSQSLSESKVADTQTENAPDNQATTTGTTPESRSSVQKEESEGVTAPTSQTTTTSSSSRSLQGITEQKSRSTTSSIGTTSTATTSAPTTTSRRAVGGTYSSQSQKSGSSTKGKTGTTSSEKVQSTETVTSSYGIGPVDDDGTPLFGLRALRKIKQVQEQMETTSESPADTDGQKIGSSSSTSSPALPQPSSNAPVEPTVPTKRVVPSSTPETTTPTTSFTTNLRSNDMYGLRALRKHAAASTSADNEEIYQPSSSSREKEKRTSGTVMSTTVSSSQNSNATSSTSRGERVSGQSLSRKSSELEKGETKGMDNSAAGESVTSSTTSVSNESGRKLSSPKSILKKTSSFTGSARKTSSGGLKDEQVTSSVVASEVAIPEGGKAETSTRSGSSSTTTATTARSSTTSSSRKDSNASTTSERKMSSKVTSQDDESWRRQRSTSPASKQVASASTASSIATFSRGKVGRSSVREMSKRFQESSDDVSDQTIKASSSTTSISSEVRTSTGRESPSMSRGTREGSPSRIPLSIKSTTVSTVTTSDGSGVAKDTRENIQSSEMTGVSSSAQSMETGEPGGVCKIREQNYQQQTIESSSTGSRTTVVQSRVVTSASKSSSRTTARSFLTDQSPIQNLEDVIVRMRGEDHELMPPFGEQDGEATSTPVQSNQGRNLLNKFIGAQVIMQAVEPMLKAQKVSMSSSLEQSGVDVETETDTSKLREMLESCEGEEERDRIQCRIKSLGGSSSVEVVEERRSSSTQLIQQSSTASESGDQQTQQQDPLVLSQSGGTISASSTSADVTVESKAKKSAEAVTSSSSKSVECEQSSDMKASSSFTSSSSSSTTSMASSSVSTATNTQSVSSSSSTIKSMSRSSIPAPPMNKFKAMDLQANQGKKAAAPLFKFANDGLKASAGSAKEMLLYWCQCRTRDYESVKIDNFSSSWSDGLAFCALIHHFYPDAFDFNSLNPRNRKHNFDLAFRTAEEKAGIYPLLDTEDMVAMGTRPDWKCVFTYVQSMYHKLKDM